MALIVDSGNEVYRHKTLPQSDFKFILFKLLHFRQWTRRIEFSRYPRVRHGREDIVSLSRMGHAELSK